MIPSLPTPGQPKLYLAQMYVANQWVYYATQGYAPGSNLLFLFYGYGSRPFRPSVPVVPDN